MVFGVGACLLWNKNILKDDACWIVRVDPYVCPDPWLIPLIYRQNQLPTAFASSLGA